MDTRKAEQAILNGTYAGAAWLTLDVGLFLREHGARALDVLAGRPELIAGLVIVVACIIGLARKSRTAAAVLFLFFLVPLVLRAAQGVLPSAMMLIFSLILLYFFLAALLGTLKYHQLLESERRPGAPD